MAYTKAISAMSSVTPEYDRWAGWQYFKGPGSYTG